eukprot:11789063-Prorocentrum_lima.AAC.1
MTSSLVGSEMCIRDSPRTVWQLCHGPQAAALGLGCALTSRRSAPITVSYTHLTLPTICSV